MISNINFIISWSHAFSLSNANNEVECTTLVERGQPVMLSTFSMSRLCVRAWLASVLFWLFVKNETLAFVLLTRLPIQYSINRTVEARQTHGRASGVCLHVSLPNYEYMRTVRHTFHTQMFVSLCEFNGFYGEFAWLHGELRIFTVRKIQIS